MITNLCPQIFSLCLSGVRLLRLSNVAFSCTQLLKCIELRSSRKGRKRLGKDKCLTCPQTTEAFKGQGHTTCRRWTPVRVYPGPQAYKKPQAQSFPQRKTFSTQSLSSLTMSRTSPTRRPAASYFFRLEVS